MIQTPTAQRFSHIVASALLVAFVSFDCPAHAAEPVTAAGISAPSMLLKLSFHFPGVVSNVSVKEGDSIKVGDVLLMEDDRIEQKQLESLRLEGNSTLTIEAQKADLAAKQVEYKRKQQMFSDRVASDAEVEEAKLAVDLAAIRVKLAEQENAQKKLDAGKQEIKVEQMRLVSPIDGIVQKLNVGQGEMADPQNRDGAAIVVKNDPLWIETHLPTSQAGRLEIGETLDVRYTDSKDWQPAKVIYFAPMADAASDTQLVRMELSNKTNRASGLQVLVKLPPKLTGEIKTEPSANVNP